MQVYSALATPIQTIGRPGFRKAAAVFQAGALRSVEVGDDVLEIFGLGLDVRPEFIGHGTLDPIGNSPRNRGDGAILSRTN